MSDSTAMAQTLLSSMRIEADADVRQTALDYFIGWNLGDVDRMGRSLHPDLAKRIVRPAAEQIAFPPGDRLEEMSTLRLLQLTQHDPVPEYEAQILILDRLDSAASVKIGGKVGPARRRWGAEYDHLVRWNGRWLILHVLWGLQPLEPDDVDESSAITGTALDYLDSYYEHDSTRMERTLHPHVAKDAVIRGGSSPWHDFPGDALYRLSAHSLLQLVARPARSIPESERQTEVTLLDCSANAACVRVDASAWIEYLHLCKWNGRWLIVDAVRVMRRDDRAQAGERAKPGEGGATGERGPRAMMAGCPSRPLQPIPACTSSALSCAALVRYSGDTLLVRSDSAVADLQGTLQIAFGRVAVGRRWRRYGNRAGG